MAPEIMMSHKVQLASVLDDMPEPPKSNEKNIHSLVWSMIEAVRKDPGILSKEDLGELEHKPWFRKFYAEVSSSKDNQDVTKTKEGGICDDATNRSLSVDEMVLKIVELCHAEEPKQDFMIDTVDGYGNSLAFSPTKALECIVDTWYSEHGPRVSSKQLLFTMPWFPGWMSKRPKQLVITKNTGSASRPGRSLQTNHRIQILEIFYPREPPTANCEHAIRVKGQHYIFRPLEWLNDVVGGMIQHRKHCVKLSDEEESELRKFPWFDQMMSKKIKARERNKRKLEQLESATLNHTKRNQLIETQ